MINTTKQLADIAERMQALSSSLNDENTARSLARVKQQMSMGLVRVALLGMTSCGKSTTINAILKNIIVPENPNTSTPMPVWIYHHDQPEPDIHVREAVTNAQGQKESVLRKVNRTEFLKAYCYNFNSLTDPDRERFAGVEYGTVGLNSSVLDNDTVLLDTLGIAATTVDTRKTVELLEDDIDLVVFVTNQFNILESEVDFLQTYVLGLHPDRYLVRHPVRPENLIFVYNDKINLPLNKLSFEESVEKVYMIKEKDGSTVSMVDPDTLREIKAQQVFYINALYGRLETCGVFPYVDYAPNGSLDKELVSLAKRENREKLTNAQFKAGELAAPHLNNIEDMVQGIRRKTRRMSRGANSVAFKRVAALEEILNQMKLAANARVSAMGDGVQLLDSQRDDLKALDAMMTTQTQLASAAMEHLCVDYKRSFSQLFNLTKEETITTCGGQVANEMRECPEGFPDYKGFASLHDAELEALLEPYLMMVQTKAVEATHQKLKEDLDKKQHFTYGGVTPFEVLEQTRKSIANQMTLFNKCIDALREKNVDMTLGVMLPSASTVDELCGVLTKELEARIYASIESVMRSTGKEFQAKLLKQCLKRVNGNFFQMLFKLVFHPSRDKIWQRILNEVLEPLIQELLKGLDDLMNVQTEGIGKATKEAFDTVGIEIGKYYDSLKATIDSAIEMTELKRQSSDEEVQNAVKELKKISQECTDINQKLQEILMDLSEEGEEAV